MKSKKAEVYLNRIYKPGSNTMKHKAYSRENAEKAVEIAEQEMKERAIKSHRFSCLHLKVCDIKMDGTCYMTCKMELPYRECSNECQFMKEFIDELNE